MGWKGLGLVFHQPSLVMGVRQQIVVKSDWRLAVFPRDGWDGQDWMLQDMGDRSIDN